MKKLFICLLMCLCMALPALADRNAPETAGDIRAACTAAMDEGWVICTGDDGQPLFAFSGGEAIAFMTDGARMSLCFFSKTYDVWHEAWRTAEPLFGTEGLIPADLYLSEEDGAVLLELLLHWGENDLSVTARQDFYPGSGNWYVTGHTVLMPTDNWFSPDERLYLTTWHDTPPLLDHFTLSAAAQEPVLIEGNTLLRYPESRTDAHYTVPDGVEIIGDGAFFQNPYLTSITLPESVDYIGAAAFQYCENLQRIDMPERMHSIGQGAFVGTKLTTLRIPLGVKELAPELLMQTPCLTDVYLPGTLDTIAGRDLEEGWDFGDVSDDPALMLHAEHDDGATFARLSGHPYIIESAYRPTSTQTVAQQLELPDDWDGSVLCTDEHGRPMLTYSSDFAFALLSDGGEVYLHCFTRIWDELGWTGCMGGPLFGVDEGLIPHNIWLVDENLTIVLGWGEKSVLLEAAYDVNGWGEWFVTAMELLVPDGSGWSAESRTAYDTPIPLYSYSLVEGEQPAVLIEGNTLLRYPESRTDAHYTVPDGIEIIAPNAFEGNSSLVRVTLPQSVRVIGDEAFAYCQNLRVVDMPATLEALGTSAFECTYVQQLTLPEGLTEIPQWAFCAADLHGTIVIPEGVTDLGDECFCFNATLPDQYLPASLLTMGGESVDEGWGFDFIYGFNHIDPGQEHMTVHAPAGTEAAKFAERSGYPYVIEDARGGTDLSAMTALVQSVLDRELPGAAVCRNESGFPCVSYGADTVFAFATRETDGWYDEWYLCCFRRTGDSLTLLWTNDCLYGSCEIFWPESLIPLDMKLIGDAFTLTLQVGSETALGLTFSGENWLLQKAVTSVWYEPGDGGPNHWLSQLSLPISGGAPLRDFSTVPCDPDE